MKNDPPIKKAESDKDAIRRSDSDIEELKKQILALQKQNAEIQTAVNMMTKIIMGNGGPGLREALAGMQETRATQDRLSGIVEALGRLFENLHHQGQEREGDFTRLADSTVSARAWREIAEARRQTSEMWQSLFMTQHALLKAT